MPVPQTWEAVSDGEGMKDRWCQLARGSRYHTHPSTQRGGAVSLLCPAPRYNIGKLRQQESNLELQLVTISTPDWSEAASQRQVGKYGRWEGRLENTDRQIRREGDWETEQSPLPPTAAYCRKVLGAP